MNLMEELLDLIDITDIIKGYIYLSEKRSYICLICGEIMEEDIIYKSNNQDNLINARRAMEEHIEYVHEGVFNYLINLDSRLTGLTNRQKEIFEILSKYRDNQKISELMNTTPATVRSYKYKKREKARQSKIFLAIAYLIQQSDMKGENIQDQIINKVKEYKRELVEEDRENIDSVEDILSKRNLDYIGENTYE